MLADNDPNVRESAVTKVIKLRELASAKQMPEDINSEKIRYFKVPTLNFETAHYYELFEIDKECITEPPAIRHLSIVEIQGIRSIPLTLAHPCHNQAVERHVKLVSQASSMATTFERRDGMIRQQIRSHTLMKCFDSKKQFMVK